MASKIDYRDHRMLLPDESGYIDIMIAWSFLLAPVTVDYRFSLAGLQPERGKLLLCGNRSYCISHERIDHPELPLSVCTPDNDGSSSGSRGRMGMYVMDENVFPRKSRPL